MKHLLPILMLTVSGAASALPSGLPNPKMTPGTANPAVTQSDIRRTICRHGYTRAIRPPERYTERLKRRQLHAYHYRDQHIWHYEEDHLVPLEVGGNPTDPRNLWPEPRYGHWNARRKDRLENVVHRLVCSGRLSLRQGRTLFERNWIKGYEHYLGRRTR
ncbi:MAG: hypothetical protein P8124_10055 [Gammaproteobacteria bacterium]